MEVLIGNMEEHRIKVGCTRYGTKVLSLEDDEVEVSYQNEREEVVGTAFCDCGEKFRDLSDAEDHLKEVEEDE